MVPGLPKPMPQLPRITRKSKLRPCLGRIHLADCQQKRSGPGKRSKDEWGLGADPRYRVFWPCSSLATHGFVQGEAMPLSVCPSCPAPLSCPAAQPKPAQAIIFTNPAEHAMSCSCYSGHRTTLARRRAARCHCNAGGGALAGHTPLGRGRKLTDPAGLLPRSAEQKEKMELPVGAPFLGLGSLLLGSSPFSPFAFCQNASRATNEGRNKPCQLSWSAGTALPLRSSPQQKGPQGGNKTGWCHAGLVVRFRRRQDTGKRPHRQNPVTVGSSRLLIASVHFCAVNCEEWM